MPVVLVLPCVPATATARLPSITEASAAALCSTRRPPLRASASSGLVSLIAVETTSVSAPSRCAASCPTCTSAPSEASVVSISAGWGGVAPGPLPPPAKNEARDPRHARPADPGEVHPAELAHRHRRGHDPALA